MSIALVPIKNDNGHQSVNGRDLHQALEVGKDFSSWMKSKIDQYDFIEQVDYITVSSLQNTGRPRIEYILTINMAKELALVERNEKGKQIRQYFIQAEERFRETALTSQVISKQVLGGKEKHSPIYILVEDLLQVVRQNLNRGDLSSIVKEHNISSSKLSKVLKGKQLDFKVINLLYEKARENIETLHPELLSMKDNLERLLDTSLSLNKQKYYEK